MFIISGKDRGRKGKIVEALPKEGKIVVEGINIHKKHRRPKRQGQKGEVVGVPSKLDASNAKLVCPKCAKFARIGYKVTPERKYRVCKECGEEV